MKFLNKIIILLFNILLFSCTYKDDDREIRKDLRVLIVGNSIVKHSPAPNLGWYGDWGMAATSPEKDFYHVLTKLLQNSNKYNSVNVDAKNIAYWENDFTYDLNQYIDISNKTYDVLIVRLGENVGNTDEYYNTLNDMINHFKDLNTKVIITDVVWYNQTKETIHQQIAFDNNYKYISFADFQNNPSNYSWDLFDNGAVAAHPSDLGMQNLAELLYNATLELY